MSEDEYQQDDNQYEDPEDEPDDIDPTEEAKIEIENLFVEADEQRPKNQEAAALLYEQVIELEAQHNFRDYTLKSLKFLIIIYRELSKFDQMIKKIDVFIVKMVTDSRDNRNEALKDIIASILKIEDAQLRNDLIGKVMNTLWEDKNLLNSWTKMGLFLITKFLDLREFRLLENMINKLKFVCKETEQNNNTEASNILEIYSVEIQYCLLEQRLPEIQSICRKARRLNSVLNNPRIMGIIQETTGKLLLFDKFYEQGNNVLHKAFIDYQNTGNFAAKEVLQYWILSSILSDSEVNPADTQEARAYNSDFEVQKMFDLRRYWEQNSLDQFNGLVDNPVGPIRKNEFMREFIPDLKKLMALKKLKDLIFPNALEKFMDKQSKEKKQLEENLNPQPFTPVVVTLPYSKLKLSFLKHMIQADDEKDIKKYLTQLLLENQIKGGIDDIEGVFEVYNVNQNESNNTEEQLFSSLNKWSNSVKYDM